MINIHYKNFLVQKPRKLNRPIELAILKPGERGKPTPIKDPSITIEKILTLPLYDRSQYYWRYIDTPLPFETVQQTAARVRNHNQANE